MKTLKEFILENEDYQDSHRMDDDPDFNATIDDMTKEGELVPEDFYDLIKKGREIYGDSGNNKANKEVISVLLKIKGKPNAKVTLYRAVPEGVDSINYGDWVTLSKDYAKVHLKSRLKNKGEILSIECLAKEVQWDGNSIAEMGYFGK